MVKHCFDFLLQAPTYLGLHLIVAYTFSLRKLKQFLKKWKTKPDKGKEGGTMKSKSLPLNTLSLISHKVLLHSFSTSIHYSHRYRIVGEIGSVLSAAITLFSLHFLKFKWDGIQRGNIPILSLPIRLPCLSLYYGWI